MATSPSVITAPSAPMSNFSQIGEALNAPEPSQAGTDTPTEAAPESVTEPEVQSQPEVTETGEQAEVPAEATAAETETQEANPYDEPEDSDFKPQTLTEILKTPDGRKMLANHKAFREIAKAIGPITVEQAKQHYGAFRDWSLMNEDISSGNPQQAERLITHLFNPGRGNGAQIAAAQFGPTLAKSNPEAYQAAAQPFLSNYGNALWDRFTDTPDPQKWEGSLKQFLYNAAQAVHKDLTGKYRDVQNGSQPVAQNDQFTQQRADLEAREQKIAQIERQNVTTAQQQWVQSVEAQIGKGIDAELDKALAKAKSAYDKAPRIYTALKKEFHDEIRKNAPQNKAAWDIFQANLAKARRSGSADAIDGLVKEYIRLAEPVIRSNRNKYLEEAGVATVNANQAQHAELRSIESHKAPSNGGAPVKPSKGAPIQRQAGESQSAFNLRQLRS